MPGLYRPPAAIRTHTLSSPGTVIDYPQVTGLANPGAEYAINRAILRELQEMRRQQQAVQTGTHPETTGHFEIKTNERGILSLILTNYTYSRPMAHGFTVAKALTFSIRTGKEFSLGDLFRPGSGYTQVLSAIVTAQAVRRKLPLLNGTPVPVQTGQDYYLADKALVLFYPLYAITPYYVGFPMFPVSVYDLQEIWAEGGPLDVLAADAV